MMSERESEDGPRMLHGGTLPSRDGLRFANDSCMVFVINQSINQSISLNEGRNVNGGQNYKLMILKALQLTA